MGQVNNLTIYEHYKQELNRISWRIQYRERVKRNKEFTIVQDIGNFITTNFVPNLDNRIFITELLDHLSSDVGRKIIVGFYLEGKSEKEISNTLNMSQQGVNKCKKKMLKELSLIVNSTN